MIACTYWGVNVIDPSIGAGLVASVLLPTLEGVTVTLPSITVGPVVLVTICAGLEVIPPATITVGSIAVVIDHVGEG